LSITSQQNDDCFHSELESEQEYSEYREKMHQIACLPAFRQQDALFQLTKERRQQMEERRVQIKKQLKQEQTEKGILLDDVSIADSNDNNNDEQQNESAFQNFSFVDQSNQNQGAALLLISPNKKNNYLQRHNSPSSPVPQRRYTKLNLQTAMELILMSPFGVPRMTPDFWNKLTTLDLSGQGRIFGDEGAIRMSEFLKESQGICPIERIALRANHISDVGFDALIWALFDSENRFCRELDLRQNVIPDSAAKLIVPELRTVRCVLRSMLLDDNAVSQETASLLATGLLLCGQPAAVRRIVANLEDEVDICRAVELSRAGVEDLACKLLLQAIRKRKALMLAPISKR
jgi:hypothetical protein